MRFRYIILLCFTVFCYQSVFSKITLPSIFSDHMVLQRNDKVLLWGWGNTGEEIHITTGWDNKTYSTKTTIAAAIVVFVEYVLLSQPVVICISSPVFPHPHNNTLSLRCKTIWSEKILGKVIFEKTD